MNIVLTNGCFDVLHAGHAAYLKAAKRLGDLLVVGLNTDESIRKLKGRLRPINRFEDRAFLLRQLSFVDWVLAIDFDCVDLIRSVRPQVYCKGGDYNLETMNQAERAACVEVGAKIVFIPVVHKVSTSLIIEKLSHANTPQN